MRSRVAVSALALALGAFAPAPARADKVDDLSRALTSDPDFKVRLTAALVLGKLRDRRSIPALVRGLSDTNETVRGMSASALGGIGDPVAAAALQPLERDRSEYVRARAHEALLLLRPSAGTAATRRPASGTILLALGAIHNATPRGGPRMAARLREALVKEVGELPAFALVPDGSHYLIEATITDLRERRAAFGAEILCEVSFIVVRLPSRGIVGSTSGGATVQRPRTAYEPGREEAIFGDALDHAVRAAHPNLVELLGRVRAQENR